jgi:NlpC/P60 family
MPSRPQEIGGIAASVQRMALALAAGVAVLTLAGRAPAADPLRVLREFCQADGRGARLAPSTWGTIANLVGWRLEPAWDHLYLIGGYEFGSPRLVDGTMEVEVRYTVTADVHSHGVTKGLHVDTRTYALEPAPDGTGWRIRPPAPPPYVFASEADADALAALLDPETSDYVSDSGLVWQLLHNAGWEIPYTDVADLANAPEFTPERTAQVGDLVLYYDGDTPYHVGVVESEDQVVSSTLNGGVRRAPFAAFAGVIKYRRPLPTAGATPTAAAPSPTRRARRRARPKQKSSSHASPGGAG